jgi:hypothetical protein
MEGQRVGVTMTLTCVARDGWLREYRFSGHRHDHTGTTFLVAMEVVTWAVETRDRSIELFKRHNRLRARVFLLLLNRNNVRVHTS